MINKYVGICCNIAVVRIFNNTKSKLDSIKVFYENNLGKTSMEIKNIKPKTSKQTGIHTMNAINDDLKVKLNGNIYIIKKGLKKDYINTLVVKINESENQGGIEIIADEYDY